MFKIILKVAPLPGSRTLDGDGAAVRADHGLGNRQPEAKPSEPSRDRALSLLESIKDFVDLVRADPDPVIDRPDFDLVVDGLEVSTEIRPPSAVNFTAFLIRFQKTCCRRAGSPLT